MEQLLSFDNSGFQYAWDSTSLSNFVTCPRKYFYENLQGWQSEERSVHLIFGGHYAAALEGYHKLVATGVGKNDATREIVRKLLTDTWDEKNNRPQDWMHNTKTRDTLIRSVVWYLDHFSDDPMPTVILSDGRPAVEYSFSFELSPNYLYCGHIDRLVEYSGGVYVQDQKTTGAAITAKYFSDFKPDYQMSGYTLAGIIGFAIPILGVVIDAAQIAVGFTRFARGHTSRSMPELEEFRHETLHYIELAKAAHDTGYYPMNRKACGNYGGCVFRSICSANPVHREALLAAKFTRRDRWDPLKKR